MALTDQVQVGIRSVTSEEVETFHENHWVRLPGLLSAEFAAALLARAKRLMDAERSEDVRPERGTDFSWWLDFHYPSREDELFASVATSAELGHNAARLFGRDSSIRVFIDQLAVKLPAGKARQGGQPTAIHQDYWPNPIDCSGLSFWIALDEVTPEQGSLRFYNGSHKLGLLGRLISEEEWPRLARCPRSEPLHLRAGDATAHSTTIVHCTSENSTDRPRWAYIVICYPGDALYTNRPHPDTDGLGLEPGQPLEHPKFPIIYSHDA